MKIAKKQKAKPQTYIDESGNEQVLTTAITRKWVGDYWGMPYDKLQRILDKAIEKDKKKAAQKRPFK